MTVSMDITCRELLSLPDIVIRCSHCDKQSVFILIILKLSQEFNDNDQKEIGLNRNKMLITEGG